MNTKFYHKDSENSFQRRKHENEKYLSDEEQESAKAEGRRDQNENGLEMCQSLFI